MGDALPLIVLLFMLGGGGSKKPKPKPKPDHQDEHDEPEDTKCPMGAPLIYTGYGFNVDLDDPALVEAEKDLTSQERNVIVATLDALQGDEGFPAFRSGVCLQEDLSAWYKVTKNGKSAAWSSLAGLLAWHMFASPQGPWITWDEMTLQQRARASRFAAAAKLREQTDENAENDPGGMPAPSPTPTPGGTYRVKVGENLLQLAGLASGAPSGSLARREYAKKIATHPVNLFATKQATKGSFDDKYLGGRTVVLTPQYSCSDEVSTRGSGECFPLLYFP